MFIKKWTGLVLVFFFEGVALHVDAPHDYFSVSGFCYYPSKAPSAQEQYYSRQ